MNAPRDDLVDIFLADLGAPPAPEALASAVGQRIRDGYPRRRSVVGPWLAAAAVVALLAIGGGAWIVAAPGPSPTPAPSPSPTPGPSPRQTAEPSAASPFGRAWRMPIRNESEDVTVALTVLDRSGAMAGVAQASSWPAGSDERPFALQVGPGSDATSITVSWIGSICDEQATLELAADGHTLSLWLPPQGNCDTIGVGFRVELRFAHPVDPATFAGSWTRDEATPGPSTAPTPAPPVTGSWDVTLTDAAGLRMALRVEDRSGSITDAADTDAVPAGLGSEDLHALVLGRGSGPGRMLVGWTATVCDTQGTLELEPDDSFTLTLPPRSGCDAQAIGWVVELTFDRPVDPGSFVGTLVGPQIR